MTNRPTTIAEHKAALDAIRPLADALPADAVRDPEIPVDTYLKEGWATLASAREHLPELLKVGFQVNVLDTFEVRLTALESAERVWQAEQPGAKKEETQRLIASAYALRGDAFEVLDYALRSNLDGQARLTRIRQNEGLADLQNDLGDAAALVSDAASLVAAIKTDPAALAKQLLDTKDALQKALAGEDALRSIVVSKDFRDRVLALCEVPLDEIRATGRFAFRKDTTNARRAAYFSAYERRKVGRRKPPAA